MQQSSKEYEGTEKENVNKTYKTIITQTSAPSTLKKETTTYQLWGTRCGSMAASEAEVATSMKAVSMESRA